MIFNQIIFPVQFFEKGVRGEKLSFKKVFSPHYLTIQFNFWSAQKAQASGAVDFDAEGVILLSSAYKRTPESKSASKKHT